LCGSSRSAVTWWCVFCGGGVAPGGRWSTGPLLTYFLHWEHSRELPNVFLLFEPVDGRSHRACTLGCDDPVTECGELLIQTGAADRVFGRSFWMRDVASMLRSGSRPDRDNRPVQVRIRAVSLLIPYNLDSLRQRTNTWIRALVVQDVVKLHLAFVRRQRQHVLGAMRPQGVVVDHLVSGFREADRDTVDVIGGYALRAHDVHQPVQAGMNESAAGVQFEVQLHDPELLAQAVEELRLVPLAGERLSERILALEDRRRTAESAPSKLRGEDSMARRQPHIEGT